MEKIFFSNNIKYLRLRVDLNQENLAKELSMSRVKLNALESGRIKGVQPIDLLLFSDYFKVSVDTLLRVDLKQLGELRLRELIAGNDVYMMGTHIRAITTTVNEENEENVELVPVAAKAGYSRGYNDPAYIASLERYRIPGLPRDKSYRIFPTEGDSMLPIPEGSLVVGEYVQDWLNLKSGTLCIVILKSGGEDMVFKKIENRLRTEQQLLLHSLNEIYQPYSVAGSDVLEVWKMVSYIANEVPTGGITLTTIANSLKDISFKIDGLSK